MMLVVSRRHFLCAAAGAFAMAAMPRCLFAAAPTSSRPSSSALTAATRTLDIAGRSVTAFGLVGPDGRSGLMVEPGQGFRAALRNDLPEPTVIHWHGQTPPVDQDGVAPLSQSPLRPGHSQTYAFPARPGTHWMHSHFGLQEMRLLAAPLIVRSAADLRADRQEVVLLLQDFTFREPAEVLAGLSAAHTHGGASAGSHAEHGGQDGHGMAGHGMAGHDMAGYHMTGHDMGGHGTAGHGMGSGMMHDLNDIEFDAYLANDRTLDDPEVVRVDRGGQVLLRVINGATGTVFYLDTGVLDGELVAVDGNPVVPLRGRRFGLAMGQRADILVRLPAGEGVWPILALREGGRQRTGLILATAGGRIGKIASEGDEVMPGFGVDLERQLRAIKPLPARPADRRLDLALTGTMSPYVWSLDGEVWGRHEPLPVKKSERVEIVMRNRSMMAHPMHLHGHHMQVISLNGQAIPGAIRDTVHVPPMGQVTVAFEADNPGRWVLHCHNLPHMVAGMMTELRYEA